LHEHIVLFLSEWEFCCGENEPANSARAKFISVSYRARRRVGEARAFTALQGHVSECDQPFMRSSDVGQSGAALREIGCVDLGDVAQAAPPLVPGPPPGDKVFICLGVRFCASSMMRYLLMKVPPAHEIERLDLDPGADQVARCGRPHSPASSSVLLRTSRCLQRPHPGRHFFLFGARQEADVFADRHGDPGHMISE